MNILVIAGTRAEFASWQREFPERAKRAVYVASREILCGWDAEECVLLWIGTYYERDDYLQLKDSAFSSGLMAE